MTKNPEFKIASPFITCDITFPVSKVTFALVIAGPSVSLILSEEYPLVVNVPPPSLIIAPLCPKMATPEPPNSILEPPWKLTVEPVVTIAPTPLDPFNLIFDPLAMVTSDTALPPPFPI